jgi:hypothetical protein
VWLCDVHDKRHCLASFAVGSHNRQHQTFSSPQVMFSPSYKKVFLGSRSLLITTHDYQTIRHLAFGYNAANDFCRQSCELPHPVNAPVLSLTSIDHEA